MTEAVLGFRVDSSQAAGAASDLDRLTASSGKAEQAANKVSLAATKASRSFSDISPALERIIAGIEQLNQTSTSISSKLDAMARAATGAARSAKSIGDAANDAGKGVDNLNDKIRKVPESTRSFGDQASHVKAFRDEIDRLAAKFAPVQTAAQKYATAVSDIQSAHRLNIISAQQMTAELDKERAAFERLNAAASKAPGRGPTAANSNELSEGNRRFIGRDIGFQLQDIAVTAAGGMSPKMIALQQGTQIAGAVQGLTLKQTGQALAGAFAGVLNPVALASIAITGLSAAAIQFFMNGTNKAKSLDDVLKSNAETLDRLKDSYGELAKVSASIGSVGGSSFVLSEARSQQVAMQATMRDQLGGFLGAANNNAVSGALFGSSGVSAVNSLQNLKGDQKQFGSAVSDLLARVKSGQPGLEKFNEDVENLYNNLALTSKDPMALRAAADAVEGLADKAFSVGGKFKPFQDAINILKVRGVEGLSAFGDQVHRIGEEKGISKLADELISKGGDIVKLAQQAETLRRTLQAIDREDTRPGMRDRDSLPGYVARRDATLRQVTEQFNADQQQQNARTFSERIAAADRLSRAQRPTNMDEGGGVAARAARAVEAERNRQSRELRDAALSRSTSLQSAISDQQQEISLVGKAGAEQASLRKQYELTSQIRLEAIKNGVEAEGRFSEVYGKELESIKTLSAEYGRLVEARARAQLSNDLSFQRDQLGRSPEQRRIADQLRGAGLPVDLLSKQAAEIAKTNAAMADQRMGFAREGFNAQVAGINARTPAEKIAAARAAAAAQHNDGETDPERAQRINDAEAIARAQVNRQQADADRERSMNLRRLLEQQQEDIDLIGKTGAAAEAAREQHQLMAQLRQQAAQQGITSETEFQKVFAKQIDQIKVATDAYEKLAAQRGQAQFNFDITRNMADARLSPRDRQIVQTQRQYGLPENPSDANGQRIGKQLDWQDAKDQAKQFGSAFSNELISGSHNIGKAFLKGFQTSLESEASKLWEKFFDSIGNIFADWVTGTKSGSSATSSLGSVGSKLLGGGASNDNKPLSATGAGSALSFVGNYKSGVDPRLTDILNIAATKTPGLKIDAISGFRAGDPRFHGKGEATDVQLTDIASGKMLGNYQDPTSFAAYERFAQTARSVQMDKYPELANRFRWGGYFGGGKGKYGAVDQMHFDLGGDKVGMGGGSWANGLTSQQAQLWPGIKSTGMNDATQALDKLAGSAGTATQGLGTFGTGLGQLGQSLGSSVFPAAPQASGGGGLFGLLGGLFSSPFKAMGPQGAAALAGKFKPGLFASGTNYAPGGPAIVGENGPELLDLPQGSQVTSNHKLMSALAANANQPQPNRQLNVNIQGASGDEHIRSLVQQGVGSALSEYNTQQRRGGFGVLQARYGNQKG